MDTEPSFVAVLGAGPAGLMAAETIAAAGHAVRVYERMPSPARKLLMAGRGGLNLTHSEPLEAFLTRYAEAMPALAPAIRDFPPQALVAWAEGLGQEMFTGSSGRIFPRALKASPLLRAWLARLESQGVQLLPRHEWRGFTPEGGLRIGAPSGQKVLHPAATVLALGGASWPRLGADGSWAEAMAGVEMRPFRPANMGFRVGWSEIFRRKFEGTPLKRIALSFGGRSVRGEAMITAEGIEGGAIYALSAPLRDAIAAQGHAMLALDLRPDITADDLARKLDEGRRGQSLSTFLRKAANLSPVAIGLVQEALHQGDQRPLSAIVKALSLRLEGVQGLERAISSAGGIALAELDEHFMLRARPGLFAAGEMLDWEAPTGGYLLQACFATGRAAALGAAAWLKGKAG
ncbi:putative flavoprotein, PP_4765 family [Acetobacteraceae bacterium AT-5844]|nr:putative flavoprotein, PP_4765 family [Acetobacteraceae bacterium AT-5844]